MTNLSPLNRLLPLWIGAAMVAGPLLGRTTSGLDTALSAAFLEHL